MFAHTERRNENVARRLGVSSERIVRRFWLLRISQPGVFTPEVFHLPPISLLKFPSLYLKMDLTGQILNVLKSVSVWLLLLNGPKCFIALGGANLAIHREAVSL